MEFRGTEVVSIRGVKGQGSLTGPHLLSTRGIFVKPRKDLEIE